MTALFGIRPPFRIYQDPLPIEFVRIRVNDRTQGKLLQLTILEAASLWKNFSEEDSKAALYSYDRNSASEAFFPSARSNVYALQIHSEDGESLTYFQLTNPPHLLLEIGLTTDEEVRLFLHDSFQEIPPEEFQTDVYR